MNASAPPQFVSNVFSEILQNSHITQNAQQEACMDLVRNGAGSSKQSKKIAYMPIWHIVLTDHILNYISHMF